MCLVFREESGPHLAVLEVLKGIILGIDQWILKLRGGDVYTEYTLSPLSYLFGPLTFELCCGKGGVLV